MNYQELKEEIKTIAEISDNVPEKFKEKCFEILMNHLLKEANGTTPAEKNEITQTNQNIDNQKNMIDNQNHNEEVKSDSPENTIPLSAQLRVFMRKTNITIEEIQNIIHYENGNVYFIKEPKDSIVSKGQIKWALLLGLKNGIAAKDFLVDPEDLRSICQDKGYYDMKNFSRYLKNYSNYFKNPLIPQGDSQPLSDDGINELAKLIKELNQLI